MSRHSRRQKERGRRINAEKIQRDQIRTQWQKSCDELITRELDKKGIFWTDYTGARKKIWYDIKTKSGEILYWSYPNGTGWYPYKGRCYRDHEVAQIRPSQPQPGEEEYFKIAPAFYEDPEAAMEMIRKYFGLNNPLWSGQGVEFGEGKAQMITIGPDGNGTIVRDDESYNVLSTVDKEI